MTVESRLNASNPRPKSPSPIRSSTSHDPEEKGQIDFLNSVIVDMQRKNDELKTKLELYERAGFVTEDITEDLYMLNGVSARQVAPRLFCDICDEFDKHDTEDCPTQAMQLEEVETHTKSKGKRGQERPYCVSCEMFGHLAEDCDDGQTF